MATRDRPVNDPAGASPETVTGIAVTVRALCDVVEAIAPLGASLGVPAPEEMPWHGALFGTLQAQAARGPLVVAAVCGGTNTGKSLVANALLGQQLWQFFRARRKTALES